MKYIKIIILLTVASLFLNTFGQDTNTESHEGIVIERDANVPELPFEDNPNPLFCGIPEAWKEDKAVWITGAFEGNLIQPEVFLYDSHLRKSIVGSISSKSQIEIILFQSNPNLNYYLVRSIGLEPIQEGWVPAPFVSFEQP